MESHPVPQNISSFEFHLVGDMTLKQFGYLAAGGITGYIIYISFGTKVPILAWPIAIICALLGVAFAFLPISERPLDHWVLAFFRAIFSPTTRSYAFASGTPALDLDGRLENYLRTHQKPSDEVPKVKSNARLMAIAQMAPATQSVVVPQPVAVTLTPAPTPMATPLATPPSLAQELKTAETQIVQEVATQTGFIGLPNLFHMGQHPGVTTPPPFGPGSVPTPQTNSQSNQAGQLVEPQPQPALPSVQELQQTVILARQAQEIQNKIVETEHQLNQIKSSAAQPGAVPEQFTAQFQQILQNMKVLNDHASQISHQMAILSKTPPKAPISRQVIAAKKATIPNNLILTSQPNTLNGLVTDALNNYLDGVIVVAHDKEGLPVRALKTNKLGQFVAATPLPNGVYSVTFEKESLNFDTYQVELDGQLAPPLSVTAKKGVAV